MDALNISSTKIKVDLRKCSFENGTEYASIGCIKDEKPRNENINSAFTISNLAPGNLTNICIRASGERLIESDTLQFTKYTSKILFITSSYICVHQYTFEMQNHYNS